VQIIVVFLILEQKNHTGFAHNLKAYDGILMMKYNVVPLPTDSLPKIVLNGLKFMSIEFEKIKLIVSHNFISNASIKTSINVRFHGAP
jgi:hypothetical protein